jgi:hypothetical protein
MPEQERNQQQDPAMDRAKETAQAAGDAAREKAQTLFDTNKEAAITNATAFAGMLRSASKELNGQHEGLARFGLRAAEKIEGVCHGLEGRDLNATWQSVETYARREPALFYGGAFAAGMVVARFLKASGARRGSRSPFRDTSSIPMPAPRRDNATPVGISD